MLRVEYSLQNVQIKTVRISFTKDSRDICYAYKVYI